MDSSKSAAPRDRVLAIFDVDHTILKGDSLLWFGRFLLKKKWPNFAFAPAFFRVSTRFLLGLAQGDELKTAFLKLFCSGIPSAEMDKAVKQFAAEILAPNILQDARERIDWHQQASHEVILLSASPAIYLKELAQLLRIECLIATELVSDGRTLTGDIAGRNCKGQEKVNRLVQLFGQSRINWSDCYGYGDSFSDIPVFEHVGRPILVNPSSRLAGIARERGWRVEYWS